MGETLTYHVNGMSCRHCQAAISDQLGKLPGVASVTVELATKQVHVRGSALDDAALRGAIEEAGYEAT